MQNVESRTDFDGVVVGAGPNGLAAAVTLARAGCSVLVLEANEQVGGAARSAELTLPGCLHDVGSAIHPLGIASPLFRQLPLDRHGLQWVHAKAPLAHPLDEGRAVVLYRSLSETADLLGRDGSAYRRLFQGLSAQWERLAEEVLQPVVHVPRHPMLLARFGLRALRSVCGLADASFAEAPARALWAGIGAHVNLSLERPGSAAVGLLLTLAAHAVGWPMPRGGAGRITEALAAYLRSLGGEIATGVRVARLDRLPASRVVLLDLTPRQVLRIAGDRLPAAYRERLEAYRYGPGAFKVDYVLDEPIPWAAAECAQAGTVHLGGTLEEIAAAERAVAEGRHPERPYVLLAQPTLFDETRVPRGSGKQIVWAYCHVPNGSTFDMADRIERQIERFAPGFRDCVRLRRVSTPADLEAMDANLVGGDVNGGMTDLRQLLARPVLHPDPYRTPVPGLYLCSASTPPGGGVHGMCGYHAARTALKDVFR